MNNLAKRTARLLPRSMRNFLRAPGRTLRWWWQRGQPAVRFSPATGWSFYCTPSAIEGAFHLQLDDPPQVAEFAEFMGAINAYRDPLFFDIGCHFGLFSFAVVDRCGKASRAVAIDPSGLACDMVRRIAETNGWGSQIQVLRAAAGSQRGEIEMIDAGATSAGYFVLPTDQPARDRVRVPVCTIDDLAAEVGPPDLIKVDVEGFEGEVLAGAEKTLAQGRCRLFLEMHNRLMRDRKADPAAVLKLLAKFGYAHFSCAGHPVDERQILAEEIIRIVVCKQRPE